MKLRCPFKGCGERPQPYFCHIHWPMLTSATRREIVQSFAAAKKSGQRKSSAELEQLLDVAFAEIDVALAVKAKGVAP